MTKDAAVELAMKRAFETNKRQTLWIMGPGRYDTTPYESNDESIIGNFLGIVWPDGGIDYAR